MIRRDLHQAQRRKLVLICRFQQQYLAAFSAHLCILATLLLCLRIVWHTEGLLNNVLQFGTRLCCVGFIIVIIIITIILQSRPSDRSGCCILCLF